MVPPGRRDDRRLVDMATMPPVELPIAEQAPPDERSNETLTFDIDESGDHRAIQRMEFWRNQLIDFSLVQQIRHDGAWHDVIRADCCHREVHVHVLGMSGAETARHTLCSAATVDSVNRGFDLAHDRILDNWDENVRRWRNGRG